MVGAVNISNKIQNISRAAVCELKNALYVYMSGKDKQVRVTL